MFFIWTVKQSEPHAMSYTELEHGYQAAQPQFYVGDDGNLVPIRSTVSDIYLH